MIGKRIFMIGKDRFMIGKVTFMIGKDRFMIGKTHFMIGKKIAASVPKLPGLLYVQTNHQTLLQSQNRKGRIKFKYSEHTNW